MLKLYTAAAAMGLALVLAAPEPAVAKERRADGARTLDLHEFSAHRRKRRVVRRYYHSPRYYSYRPRYYASPYWGYRSYPRSYYRYYGGPSVSFSFGFGPRYGYWW